LHQKEHNVDMPLQVKPHENDGLSLNHYIGDGSILLAFDLDEGKKVNLAGFSIHCITPNRGPYSTNEYFLPNRLNFKQTLTHNKKLSTWKRIGSDKAPFQTFHWIHVPSAGPGEYQYTVYASYFKNSGTDIVLGPKVSTKVNLTYPSGFTSLDFGFTRGYISSQAYADRFGNKEIRPKKKSINFDTTPYQKQYQWLGAHARELIFGFLDECHKDPSIHLDIFAYDFDEPDIIRNVCKLGSRVRVFQDDAPLHTGPKHMEPKTVAALEAAGAKVKKGHFKRFAHDKVMIQKRQGKSEKVLTGSANFSLRGLYVQANSILVFDHPNVADLYEQAFEQAFTNETKFKSSQIASKWFDIKDNQDSMNDHKSLPPTSLSFAPHTTAYTLERIAEAINSAKSSVLFAIMQFGKGSVMPSLKNLSSKKGLVSLGTIESEGQLKLFKPGIAHNTAVTSFSFLKRNISECFKAEWSGGQGQVIHHKFVVCDFNDKTPVVFCGSSNLAEGGEKSNGDNLIAIYDSKIASRYAVEAIRLYDHYRFRSLHENSTSDNPLILQSTDEWTKSYYDPNKLNFHIRRLLNNKQ
jgi:phosphatidylserine/phosphatidylglycerophosphate/cardiolipin synthase-like enzyme